MTCCPAFNGLDVKRPGRKPVPDDAHRLIPAVTAQARRNALPHQIGGNEPGDLPWILGAHRVNQPAQDDLDVSPGHSSPPAQQSPPSHYATGPGRLPRRAQPAPDSAHGQSPRDAVTCRHGPPPGTTRAPKPHRARLRSGRIRQRPLGRSLSGCTSPDGHLPATPPRCHRRHRTRGTGRDAKRWRSPGRTRADPPYRDRRLDAAVCRSVPRGPAGLAPEPPAGSPWVPGFRSMYLLRRTSPWRGSKEGRAPSAGPV